MTPETRHNTDDRRRLEPTDGTIIHGAGQSDEAFAEYRRAVGETPPMLYMSYCGLRHDPRDRLNALNERLRQYANLYLVPQIGLSMTRDGSPAEHYEAATRRGAARRTIAGSLVRAVLLLHGIKGFSYISWDWSEYEQWRTWADGCISACPRKPPPANPLIERNA